MSDKRCMLVSYVKGIAIVSIVLYHLIAFYLNVSWPIRWISSIGGAGVHIFIICSGFGLMLSHMKKPLGWFRFIKRRFIKIYIPYIIIVTISACVPFMYSFDNRWGAWLSHVFLYKMFLPQYESSFGVQFWYISTIIQFYLIFVILVKIKERLGLRKYFLLSILISIIWILFTIATGIYEERIWGSFFLQYLWEFSLGMCLADCWQENDRMWAEKLTIGRLICVTGISLVLYAGLAFIGGAAKSVNDIFSCLAFGGICLILYKLTFFHKVLCWIDRISYEWYLVHILVFEVCFFVLPMAQCKLLVGVLAFALSVLTAIFYGYLKTIIKRKLRKEVVR